MAKLLVLPKLSVVMKDGTIINWYFKEGDYINKGDVLYDVEAGKMGGSAEAEDEGTLLKILVNVGEKAKCGQAVAIIGETGDSQGRGKNRGRGQKDNHCRYRGRPGRICGGNTRGSAWRRGYSG